MHMLNWDDLRLFLAVARSGRLTGAARVLGIDHTTVARRLTALESAIGSRLVERSPRGVTLTDAGNRMLAHAERIEAEILSASSQLGGEDARIVGSVRLATPEAFGTYLVAPHIARLHAAHPDLHLELIPESQYVNLTNREADLAVILNRPAAGPVVARKLVDYRLGLYASRTYLETHGPVTSANLTQHPFSWYIDELIDLPELRFLREVSADARTIFRSSSTAAQHAAVAGGLGVGILHVFAADQDPKLVRLLPEMEVRRNYWLAIHASQQRLPRIRAVASFLDDIIASQIGTF
ncbi:LysR family transcriptional regulator [Sphingobium sp.]|uniref:LysR family transcriptional regulator n=1 Tax=Sphingobium sp. TaxID=1912891 RepID=UPI00260F85A8|nr:LysR family transcriptional regulator [Sphingobium sp.]